MIRVIAKVFRDAVGTDELRHELARSSSGEVDVLCRYIDKVSFDEGTCSAFPVRLNSLLNSSC